MNGSPTELIKEKIDIVDFIGQYLQLTRAGKNWKALCPFHKEKTPSFMVSPERQSWHCFGCGAGGDIFAFLMKYENLEFGEALKILAEKAGVELKKISPQEYKYIGLLYELQDLAKKFFQEKLNLNKKAYDYILSRGLKKEITEEFELGFAPSGLDELGVYLINLGYNPEDILRSGLITKNEQGQMIDRFRNRIMFPIHNHLGKVVGFTGRILPEFESDNIGKYINSPETNIFKKSKILYGFWKSKSFIREANTAFLVEGQMDFLMSWQAGIKNVCAISGTTLSGEHLLALKKITDHLILSFDTDPAGWEAGERAIDLASGSGFNVGVVVFQNFKDPAEAAYAGKNFLGEAINKALPAPEFYFKKYLNLTGDKKIDLSDSQNLKNIRIVLQKLLNISSPINRGFWIKKLAENTQVEEKYLIEEAEILKHQNPVKTRVSDLIQPRQHSQKFNRWEILSQEFIKAILANNIENQNFEEEKYLEPTYQKILNLLKNKQHKSSDPQLDELINLIMIGVKEPKFYKLDEIKKNLFEEHFKQRKKDVYNKIKEAELKNDQDALNKALLELNNLLNSK